MPQADRTRWDQRWREGTHGSKTVSPFLVSLDDVLPRSGAALEVAGGRGLNAVWLARRGLRVTLVDISPVALALARAHARAEGVDLDLLERDIEAEGLPPGPFEVVTCFHFFHRPLFDLWPRLLAPGGWLVFQQPTRSSFEGHTSRPVEDLLQDDELPRLLHGIAVVSYEEGRLESGRREARLVARRA